MTDLHWWSCILISAVAAAVTLVCTPVALRLAKRWNCFDKPAAGKSHRAPVPYLGGSAIVISFVLVAVVAGRVETFRPAICTRSGSVPCHGRGPGRTGSRRRPPGAEPVASARSRDRRWNRSVDDNQHVVASGSPTAAGRCDGLLGGDRHQLLQPARQHGRPGGRHRCRVVNLSLCSSPGRRSVRAGVLCAGAGGLRSRFSPVQLPSCAYLHGRLGKLVPRVRTGGSESRHSFFELHTGDPSWFRC